MELKTAVGVCLIALFSATLVVLIARSLDLQAASRLELQLARIAEELEALRASGGIATAPATTAKHRSRREGLVVYYFHSNIRCPTCQAIETQSHEAVQADFAAQLESGAVAWEVINYEKPAASELKTKFEIQVPVVVLARMKEGRIEDWNRLDQVWGLVDDKPAFAEYIRDEINQMLKAPAQAATLTESDDAAAIPVPGGETGATAAISFPAGEADEVPIPTGQAEIPVPE
jgi:hypothetical protein